MTASIANDLDIAVVTRVVDAGVSVHDCWQRIGRFADAGKFLDVPSKLVAGNGDIGSFRQIAGRFRRAAEAMTRVAEGAV